jgi:hypothetical protein
VRKRLLVAAVALAAIVGSAAAESREPADVEGVLAPRAHSPAPPPAEPLAVRLVWLDPARTALGVEALARGEAQSLLRKMGLSVSWRRGKAGEAARPGEVRVILLDRGVARAPGVPILGATPTRPEGSSFVWVHVPNVRAAIGLRPGVPTAVMEQPSARAFGIALGRVVAHELVHALAPSVPHGTGLMSAKLTCRQLSAATLPVDPEVGVAVRAVVRGEPSRAPADAGTLAAATAGEERAR